jgi:hypothetical protein
MNHRLPVWHSLMYSTSILSGLLGIPAILLSALLFWLRGTMSQWEAIHFAGVMLIIVVPISGLLWLGAAYISRRKDNE